MQFTSVPYSTLPLWPNLLFEQVASSIEQRPSCFDIHNVNDVSKLVRLYFQKAGLFRRPVMYAMQSVTFNIAEALWLHLLDTFRPLTSTPKVV